MSFWEAGTKAGAQVIPEVAGPFPCQVLLEFHLLKRAPRKQNDLSQMWGLETHSKAATKATQKEN